jgi:hypothetical protein
LFPSQLKKELKTRRVCQRFHQKVSADFYLPDRDFNGKSHIQWLVAAAKTSMPPQVTKAKRIKAPMINTAAKKTHPTVFKKIAMKLPLSLSGSLWGAWVFWAPNFLEPSAATRDWLQTQQEMREL